MGILRARVAVSVVFAVHGAAVGGFAARIPWVADRLHLGAGALGAALVAPAVGAMLAMPWAGRLAHRRGGRRLVRVLLVLWSLASALPVFAPTFATLVAALFVYGAAAGMADVAMNAQGVLVEQRYGRSIMSGLHGLWSIGTLAGGGVGALAAHAGLDARIHLGTAAAVLALTGAVACTGLLDVPAPDEEAVPVRALPSRAVLFIGLVGFCAIFVEAAGVDWSAMYLRTVTAADPGTAAASYAAFAFTMAAGRLTGDHMVRRLGPVTAVRLGGLVSAAGAALVATARAPVPAIAGFALLGLGVAVAVPLAFAAAGNSGAHPGHAIAGVATIAYGAGLAAPGAIGATAHLTSLPVAFVLVSGLALVVAAAAGALRPRQFGPPPGPPPPGDPAAAGASAAVGRRPGRSRRAARQARPPAAGSGRRRPG